MKESPPREAQRLDLNSTTSPPRPAAAMLPFECLPVIMRKYGVTEAGVRPLVGRRLPDDTIFPWRTSPAKAWVQPLVEWMRTGVSILGVVLDIDTPLGLEHLGAAAMNASDRAPTPNLSVYRKASGHAHSVWILRRPVLRTTSARPKPCKCSRVSPSG